MLPYQHVSPPRPAWITPPRTTRIRRGASITSANFKQTSEGRRREGGARRREAGLVAEAEQATPSTARGYVRLLALLDFQGEHLCRYLLPLALLFPSSCSHAAALPHILRGARGNETGGKYKNKHARSHQRACRRRGRRAHRYTRGPRRPLPSLFIAVFSLRGPAPPGHRGRRGRRALRHPSRPANAPDRRGRRPDNNG